MDNVIKGDSFENLVFNIISVALKGNRLGLSPRQARLFRKKAYFSRDRQKNIIVDISIEVWLPKAKNYSLLWVCECKDYHSAIPVDDIEEFKAKLDQIAGKNIKGVFASRNALQRGALEYARSNGIGVVRVLPNNHVEWGCWGRVVVIKQSKAARTTSITLGLECQDYGEYGIHSRWLFASYHGHLFDDWLSLLKYSLKKR